jgi:MoxR-like ATPase
VSKLRSAVCNLFRPFTGIKKESEDDIFDNIYSHQNIKQIIRMALRAEQPVHILLMGESGCGKTQFLENIKAYYGERAYFTIGAHSTKAGILDYLFEWHPRIVLIDEIEHMPAKDQAVLLSLMESQILSETKYGRARQTQLKCSVFATSNSTRKMLDPLLSRFAIVNVKKYNHQEFKYIAMKILTEREHLEDENLALAIVNEIWQKGSENANIRNIIKMARLARNLNDIDLLSKTILL